MLNECGTVVEPVYRCSPNDTPVRYDKDTAVWNTPTGKLRVIEEEPVKEPKPAEPEGLREE